MHPTQITPQTTVSPALRKDVDDIIARLEDNRSRAKAVAACLLFQHGIVPKPSFVRTLISLPGKTANHVTVSGGVQEFWDDMRGKMQAPTIHAELPQALIEPLVNFAQTYWHAAQDVGMTVAREELQTLREQTHREIEHAETLRDDALRAQELAERNLQHAQGQVEAQAAEIGALKAQLEAAANKLDELNQRAGSLSATIARQTKELEEQREAAERQAGELRQRLEEERVERGSMRTSLQGEINFAKQQIESARMGERDARVRMAALEPKLEALQAERTALERQNALLAHQADAAQLRETAIKAQVDGLNAQLQAMQMDLHHTQGAVTHRDDELAAARAQIVSLAESLALAESPALSKLLKATRAVLRVELDPMGQPVYWCEKDGEELVKRTRNSVALNRAVEALTPDAFE